MNSSLSTHEMMGLLSEGTDGNKFIKLLHPRHLGDAAKGKLIDSVGRNWSPLAHI